MEWFACLTNAAIIDVLLDFAGHLGEVISKMYRHVGPSYARMANLVVILFENKRQYGGWNAKAKVSLSTFCEI